MQQRPFETLARDLVKLHPSVVQNAEQMVKERKRRPAMKVTVRKVEPVQTVTVDAEVMRTALDLAGGDPRRLQILPDGAVLVLNNPRTDKPQPNR